MKHVREGLSIVYGDHTGVEHDALCTAAWGENSWGEGEQAPCINVVYVTSDETKTDSYGRQIERDTSVPHRSSQTAPGNWWKLQDE